MGALKLFCQRPVPMKPNGNQLASEPWQPVMLHSPGDPTNLINVLIREPGDRVAQHQSCADGAYVQVRLSVT